MMAASGHLPETAISGGRRAERAALRAPDGGNLQAHYDQPHGSQKYPLLDDGRFPPRRPPTSAPGRHQRPRVRRTPRPARVGRLVELPQRVGRDRHGLLWVSLGLSTARRARTACACRTQPCRRAPHCDVESGTPPRSRRRSRNRCDRQLADSRRSTPTARYIANTRRGESSCWTASASMTQPSGGRWTRPPTGATTKRPDDRRTEGFGITFASRLARPSLAVFVVLVVPLVHPRRSPRADRRGSHRRGAGCAHRRTCRPGVPGGRRPPDRTGSGCRRRSARRRCRGRSPRTSSIGGRRPGSPDASA